MGADEFGDSGGKAAGAHSYKDSLSNWRDLMNNLRDNLFRIAKPQAHLYMFCDIDQFTEAKWYMSEGGWQVFRTPIIWHKPNGMRAPWPENGPQRKYEIILFAVKGKKPVNKLYPDLVSYPSDENRGHAAQKPVALFLDLLKRSARAGDTVLDPFAGSGTIFPACHELRCRATGIEVDPASYGLAAKRLGELK
ncbi:MAG: site-specific DNA-methyltransferase, partial [Patescibacteria group bacterium]|nr:site-specific DNA-methyltransferase [Patescibacteria group bacterium]